VFGCGAMGLGAVRETALGAAALADATYSSHAWPFL